MISSNDGWIANIQYAENEVIRFLGADSASHIYKKYGATCIEDLPACYYPEVFDELDSIISDQR